MGNRVCVLALLVLSVLGDPASLPGGNTSNIRPSESKNAGIFNVASYGVAVGQTEQTASASTSAGSDVVSVNASGFRVGERIALMGAGGWAPLAAPTDLRVQETGANGGPMIYTYGVSAVDDRGGEGPTSQPARVGSTTDLSIHDYNSLVWNQVPGAVAYKVYGCFTNCSGSLKSFFLVAVVPDNKWWDMGFPGDSITSPVNHGFSPSARRDNFFATVTAVNGNKLTLSASVTRTTGATIIRDDAVPIMQALADAARAGGGTVLIPRGKSYQIPQSITLRGAAGVRLTGEGSGSGGTVLEGFPQSNGLPIIRMIDDRGCSIDHLVIQGSWALPPAAGIVSGTLSGESTHLQIADVSIQASASHSSTVGVAFTAGAGHDANNDESELRNVTVANFADAALYIGHSNSLAHNLFNFRTAYGPVGIRTAGGSFVMLGGFLNNSALEFDLEQGVQEHANEVVGATSEDPNTALIHASPMVSNVHFYIGDSDFKAGSPHFNRPFDIDFEAGGGSVFSMENSFLHVGAGGRALFSDASSSAYLIRNDLGIHSVTYNGSMYLTDNIWSSGKVQLLNMGRAQLFQSGDKGGGFSPGRSAPREYESPFPRMVLPQPRD